LRHNQKNFSHIVEISAEIGYNETGWYFGIGYRQLVLAGLAVFTGPYVIGSRQKHKVPFFICYQVVVTLSSITSLV
jgi:hypothetical protein